MKSTLTLLTAAALLSTTALANAETLRIFSDGVTESIVNAYNTRQSASILGNTGDLLGELDTTVNRSPSAYLNNPAEERARYEDDHDTLMSLFKFVGEDGTDMGMLNFYAVHNQNVNNTNRLLNADSKGYASVLAEKELNPSGTMIGKGNFVAAFANSNKGDTSPNTNGPVCRSGPNLGMPCDFETSQCPGDNGRLTVGNCWASGPGENEDSMDSARIMGERQWIAAQVSCPSLPSPLFPSFAPFLPPCPFPSLHHPPAFLPSFIHAIPFHQYYHSLIVSTLPLASCHLPLLPLFVSSFLLIALPYNLCSFPLFLPSSFPSFLPSSTLPSSLHDILPPFLHDFLRSQCPSFLPSFLHNGFPSSFTMSFLHNGLPSFLPSQCPSFTMSCPSSSSSLAQDLFETAATPITGPVDYRIAWVPMNDTTIEAICYPPFSSLPSFPSFLPSIHPSSFSWCLPSSNAPSCLPACF